MPTTNQPTKEQQLAQDTSTRVYETLGTRFGVASVPAHLHNGLDSPQIPYANLSQKVIYVHWTIPGTSAATAGNYGVFWIAPFPCTVIGFQEVHQTAGTAGGTVSLQLEKLTGTQAPDGGTDILASAIDLKATANTVQTATISKVRLSGLGRANLAKGNRLCLKDSGTLTNVANVTIVVAIQF